jgi:ATP-dependent Clp protease ATP-binding subunit ClpA
LIDHLAEVGYDPKMGARPLSRKIDELIKIPLSKKILFENLRDCTLTVGWKKDSITFDHSKSHTGSVDENGYVVVG